eukprot:snap_masked-scaffold_25-processed-gene-5.27-mRNA-1 protein AED:1.00 eAED:1.00 QI:0/0/0/0/1/1/2/0/268
MVQTSLFEDKFVGFSCANLCNNESRSELDLLIEKLVLSDEDTFYLNTSGISYLPEFAFQCNLNLNQTEITNFLQIHLFEDLELHKDAFRACDGDKKTTWMINNFVISFFTNGNKLKFGSNTFDDDVFLEDVYIKFYVSTEDDLDIEPTSKNSITQVYVTSYNVEHGAIDSGRIIDKFSSWSIFSLTLYDLDTFGNPRNSGDLYYTLKELEVRPKKPVDLSLVFFDTYKNLSKTIVGPIKSIPEFDNSTVFPLFMYATYLFYIPDQFLK